jgi:hypothetical protein
MRLCAADAFSFCFLLVWWPSLVWGGRDEPKGYLRMGAVNDKARWVAGRIQFFQASAGFTAGWALDCLG